MDDHNKSGGLWWFGVDRKWWTLAVVGASTFMSALDGSVVNIILPQIVETTHASFSTVMWVVLIYFLTASSLLPVFGRLGDIYGQRGIYILGISVFTLSSLFCGLSPSVGWLIGFRAMQAVGSAMLFALGPAVLTGAFPGAQRGKAMGLQATMTYLGLASGPAIGGFLAAQLGWRSIFFINIPIGAIVIALAVPALERRRVSSNGQPFDPAGAVTLTISLAMLLLGISLGNRLGWGHWFIASSLVTAVVAIVIFVLVETRAAHPVLDLRLFLNRTFAASTTAAFLNYMAVATSGLLMPFYLQSASGYPPDITGLILISTPVVMAITAGPSGALSDRIGHRIPATIGMAITVIALLLFRTFQAGDGAMQVIPFLVLLGIGGGLFTSPNNSAIMGSAPREKQGVAGAILAAARNIGFAVGMAAGGAIYAARLMALESISTKPNAVAGAMHDATTAVAFVAVIGVIISATQGKELNRRS